MKKINHLFQNQLLQKMDHINIAAMNIMKPIVEEVGLTMESATILYLIQKEENCTMSHIYKTLRMNQGNLSSACKKLEQQGFLVKQREKENERIVLLKLTKEGEKKIETIEKSLTYYKNELESIPKNKQQHILEALEMLYEVLLKIEGGKNRC